MQPECQDVESSSEDTKTATELPRDWIAVMYHSKTSSNADSNDTESNCSSVIERVSHLQKKTNSNQNL